ncbi:hypothetical protein [Mycolicibacterium thermoresistibile]|uniref:Uncharacterized protein n=1 Tax=Mycolicibacterium thermoresistibile (strain ATCC 19527 / DSM 44167 / CIP 105390 / JCM 6362 / NCTC 10409 / 316) TaxID=1078020 RepID=G7CKH3_MYCT3|nr:hypothetical protein [Mycolicibacterium thermoresistibile]EHI11683.1 hypothetical protein KEK_12328 [Mycolicibacterium thermoresistibile ATCC 19527]SNW17006.1 Uncharacterised protein [Mycolicibacterium thermoresistibile]
MTRIPIPAATIRPADSTVISLCTPDAVSAVVCPVTVAVLVSPPTDTVQSSLSMVCVSPCL